MSPGRVWKLDGPDEQLNRLLRRVVAGLLAHLVDVPDGALAGRRLELRRTAFDPPIAPGRWSRRKSLQVTAETNEQVVTTDDMQDQIETMEIGPVEQNLIRASIVATWVKTLQAAEAMHICLHPWYVRNSESELTALVEQALAQRRGPSQMVAELLAEGRRSLARGAAEV